MPDPLVPFASDVARALARDPQRPFRDYDQSQAVRLERAAAVLAIVRDEAERKTVDEVDFEAMRQRALTAREAVQEKPEVVHVVNHGDITRKQATLIAAGVTLLNVLVNVVFQLWS